MARMIKMGSRLTLPKTSEWLQPVTCPTLIYTYMISCNPHNHTARQMLLNEAQETSWGRVPCPMSGGQTGTPAPSLSSVHYPRSQVVEDDKQPQLPSIFFQILICCSCKPTMVHRAVILPPLYRWENRDSQGGGNYDLPKATRCR